MLSDGPPPRPGIQITPMRPERPARGRRTPVVIGLWIGAIVLLVTTALMVALHLTEIRVALAVDLSADRPEATGDEVVRAVNIALAAGAVLVAVVVVTAVFGCARIWDGRRSGRAWLLVAVIVSAVLTAGSAILIAPSAQAVAEAGLPQPFHWIVPGVACVLGAVATTIGYVDTRT